MLSSSEACRGWAGSLVAQLSTRLEDQIWILRSNRRFEEEAFQENQTKANARKQAFWTNAGWSSLLIHSSYQLRWSSSYRKCMVQCTLSLKCETNKRAYKRVWEKSSLRYKASLRWVNTKVAFKRFYLRFSKWVLRIISLKRRWKFIIHLFSWEVFIWNIRRYYVKE